MTSDSRRPLPADTFGAPRLTKPVRHAHMHAPGGADPIGGNALSFPRRTTPIGATEVWYYSSIIVYHASPHTNTVTNVADTLRAYPFWVGNFDLHLDRIAFRVGTGQAGGVARVGIYESQQDGTLYPTTLVVDGGEKSITTATTVNVSTIDVVLGAQKIYWFVYNCNTNGGSINGFGNSESWSPIGATGLGVAGSAQKHLGWSVSSTYGALPATFPASAGVIASGVIPSMAIAVRVV